MERLRFRHAGVILAVLAILPAGCSKTEAPPPPPPAVEVAAVVQKDVPVVNEWIGSLDGFVNAEIRPQIEGYLLKQVYKEGFLVRAGETLFEIDPQAVPGDLRPGQGHPRPVRGHARQREGRRRRVTAAGGAEGHQPAGARRRRDAGTHGAGQRGLRARRAREGEARPRLDEGRLPHRRHRGRREVPGRRPREPADRHDHGFAGRSHQGLLQPERAGVPGVGREARPDREEPREPRTSSKAACSSSSSDGSLFPHRGKPFLLAARWT